MRLRRYLPSGTFASIVGAIGTAGMLILLAQYVTHRPATATITPAIQTPTQDDWQAALNKILAEGPSAPQPASQEDINELLTAAESKNVTDTVGRKLLVNLTSASAQGLGGDIPTQDKLVEQAVAELPTPTPSKTYLQADLTLVADSAAAQKAYGNAVMEVLGRHQGATSQTVLLAVSKAVDANNAKELEPLVGIQKEYEAIARELSKVPTPKTLAPLHLQIINNIGVVAATLEDVRAVLNDPLRGLGGLTHYKSAMGETARVFTSLAEILNKNGILFTKDEPGAAWAVFISA